MYCIVYNCTHLLQEILQEFCLGPLQDALALLLMENSESHQQNKPDIKHYDTRVTLSINHIQIMAILVYPRWPPTTILDFYYLIL